MPTIFETTTPIWSFRGVYPGYTPAASLKPSRPARSRTGHCVSAGYTPAASLKHLVAVHPGQAVGRFRGVYPRGLIEACGSRTASTTTRARFRGVYPRGLIEAGGRPGSRSQVVRVSAGYTPAASLKLALRARCAAGPPGLELPRCEEKVSAGYPRGPADIPSGNRWHAVDPQDLLGPGFNEAAGWVYPAETCTRSSVMRHRTPSRPCRPSSTR